MFTHETLWRALDRLAEKHELSLSALARKAGLSPTAFNPSKRLTVKRAHWPSSESLAAVLTATGCSLASFAALLDGQSAAAASPAIPLMTLTQAATDAAQTCEPLLWPQAGDPACFALEIDTTLYEPSYRKGTLLILSPVEKPRRGDRVAVRLRAGEVVLRVLSREGAHRVELSPLSGDAPPDSAARADIAWLHRILWASQ